MGLLYPISPNFDPVKNPFGHELVEGPRAFGYTLGRDVIFEFRSAASGKPLPQLAAESWWGLPMPSRPAWWRVWPDPVAT